jgi:type IV pilus assembly protein PilY1
MFRKITSIIVWTGLLCTLVHPFGPQAAWAAANEDNGDYNVTPPFLTAAAPPLVLLVMGRDHKLYYEAYNDASDLNGDGVLDVGYKPDEIDYYGYFDSFKCYTYDSGNSRFNPTSLSVSNAAGTNSKACSGASEWSGDFLNYLTMSRMDAVRKVLYGGYRSTDTASATILQRAYVPQDAHSWGKEYKDVATSGYDITEYSPLSLPTSGRYHLFASTTLSDNGNPLLRVLTNETHRIWEWVSTEGPVAGNRVEDGGSGPIVSPTDYQVRVKVCDPTVGLESNCKIYPGTDGKIGTGSDSYKPIGLLQRYGETEQMLFGLISGSYAKNTAGGVLRKAISLIADEINAKTGEFNYLDDSNVQGIIKTIDKLRIKNYDYDDYSYKPGWPDAWLGTRPMTAGEFPDWGNPTAEMMYEGLRYFAGAGSATSAFDYSTGDDVSLGLPKATWDDPYSPADRWCSQPFMLVVSDINPSYDSDQLPGSAMSGQAAQSLGVSGTLNVQTLLNTISSEEGISGSYYIGGVGATYDSACSPKAVSSLGNVYGLCPEEPTKLGSYYSASVAYYGHENDLSSATNDQKVLTYTVGLASPLPRIEIKLGNPVKTLTVIPFAKSVGGGSSCLNISPDNAFTPTNTIVDFYVESITPTAGKFRVNFEDVEQAADHDMDAIATYEYKVVNDLGIPVSDPTLGTKVQITVDASLYASGCIVQHLGYIISGTTADGTYLEVRDADTPNQMDEANDGEDGDVDFFLDTPPGQLPGGNWNDNAVLTTGPTTRTFMPGATAAAQLLTNPLWYAAKWGSFRDQNFNNMPDLDAEWDTNGDGTPDNYFYVQNPLFLERQLNQAFLAILERASSGTSASVLSSSRSGEGAVIQSIFYPRYKQVTWAGNVHALLVDAYGQIREDTNSNKALDNATDKIIEFDSVNPGVVKKYVDTDGDGQLTQAEKSAQNPPDERMETVKYLWSAANWLNSLSDATILQNKVYSATDKARYVFTFIDADNDMVADSGEIWAFSSSPAANLTAITPYLQLAPPFTQSLTASAASTLATKQIDFIRGKDQTGMRNRMFDADGDNTLDTTYRLGDIISSTPTLVGTPAENYDLLYRDASYRQYWLKYRNRRKVVYAGANDGMLHAFNAGFFYFDSASSAWKFNTQSEGGSETAYDIGAELWAYVPFNLLPHLYWLTDPNYEHIFYVDSKPKVFDAKIFADDGPTGTHPGGWGTVLVCGMGLGGGRIRTDMDHDGVYESGDRVMKSAYMVFDITNPEAAPKVLAEISFDDLGFTTSYPGAIVVKSLDTGTDPNNWYLVLGSGPNGARLKCNSPRKTFSAGQTLKGKNSGTLATIVDYDNSKNILTVKDVIGWFEENERIWVDLDNDGSVDTTTPNDEPRAYVDLANSISDQKNALSSQQAKIYIIDLKELVSNGVLKDPYGHALTGASPAGPFVDGTAFDDYTQISDFITVDLDLNYATDAMYFGTVSTTDTGLGGKLRRLVLNDPDSGILPTSPGTWDTDSVLIDVGQPITTAPTIAMDWKKRTWVFFGTGRFASQEDIADASQQSFYGIKEPWEDTPGHENSMVDIDVDADGDGATDLENEMTWEEVSPAYLMDVSNVIVFENRTIKNYNGVSFTDVKDLENNVLDTFDALQLEMEKDPYPGNNDPAPSSDIFPNGWKLDFSEARERNLGQAALLGDILTFTTYAPDPNACQNEGDSYLYATYYKTGTAFSSSVIGFGAAVDPGDSTSQEVARKQSLGKGLAVSPAMHTGKEKGTKAFVQTSTGAILVIEQANPGAVKSGRTYWMEE